MAKVKPKLNLDTELEWVGNDYGRKSRLKCCPQTEKMSLGLFTDKHRAAMDYMNAKWR